MTQNSIGFGQYVISAKLQNTSIQQTRVRAASAIVLARTWIAAGYADVLVIDPLGKILSPDGYRGAIMRGSKFYR